MRYLPGAIAISEEADGPILRAVYRAGHLTSTQLYQFLHPSGLTENSRDSFNWRVRRLAQHGFLVRIQIAGLGNVVSLGEGGELWLQGKEPAVVERASRTSAANARNQIWHDVDLFGIHLALRRAGVITSWLYETEIRAANDFTVSGYRKDYDAIVRFAIDGHSATVALEYERTAKSSREYERICADLERETRLETFLYLVPSLQMKAFVAHALRRTSRRLFVAIAQEFGDDPRRAELLDISGGGFRRLSDCLDAA